MKLDLISVEQLVKNIQETSAKGRHCGLVVDIGATNTRVGLVTAYYEPDANVGYCKLAINSIPELLGALKQIASQVPKTLQIDVAALNVPGPVDGEKGGPIANYKGENAAAKTLFLKDLPTNLFPPPKTRLLNDLEAAAYGVLASRELGLYSKLFNSLWKGTSTEPGHMILIAPGTGLGNALLQFHYKQKYYSVLPLEFAHGIYVPKDAMSESYALELQKKEKRGDNLPVFDDVVSGRGLERIYQHISGGERKKAQQIALEARQGQAHALHALREFNRYMMLFASQLGMGFVAREVVLLGDNMVSNGFFYENPTEVKQMRDWFESHSLERYGFMSRISVSRQVTPYNLNLLGCVYICGHTATAAPPAIERPLATQQSKL